MSMSVGFNEILGENHRWNRFEMGEGKAWKMGFKGKLILKRKKNGFRHK